MRQMQTVSNSPATCDWNVPPPQLSGRQGIYLAVLGTVSMAVLGAVGVALLGPAGALLAGLPVVAAAAAPRAAGRRALSDADATELERADEPRLVNMANGLARDLGVPVPRLYAVAHSGPNALIAYVGGPAIGVSRSAIGALTRTELEAVVAHCLVRVGGHGLWHVAAAVWLGPLLRAIGPWVGPEDDARACALTRYPPALQSAMQKATAKSGRFAPLWFVGEGNSHVSVEKRVAALEDL
jgi:hypothetical protein